MATTQAIEKLLSPESDQSYIYFAEYYDGTILYEYDNDHTHLKFDSIEQDKVKYFGFIGNGLKMYWEVSSTLFYIGEHQYKINIEEIEENYIMPIEKSEKKDLITFKTAHVDSLLSFGGLPKNETGNIIDGYYIGFKTKYNDNGNEIFVQEVFSIPVTGEDRRPFFGVRLSSKENKKYEISLVSTTDDNSKFSRKDIDLKDGKSSIVELYFN